jgi:predicted signal transduction protein with EAL and GGDEF domain
VRAAAAALRFDAGPRRLRAVSRGVQIALTVGTPVYLALLAWVALGPAQDGVARAADLVVQPLLYGLATALVLLRGVADPAERGPWLWMGAGMAAYTAGTVLWLVQTGGSSVLSAADALFVVFYLCLGTGVVLLARRRLSAVTVGAAMDALAAALAVAALCVLLLLPAIVSSDWGGPLELAVQLAYPVGDAALVALAATVLALTRWQPGPTWTALTVAFIVLAAADAWYATASTADAYVTGGAIDALWWLAMGLLALAASTSERAARPVRPVGWRLVVAPVVIAMAGVAVLALLVLRLGGLTERTATALVLAACAVVALRVVLLTRHTQRLWRADGRALRVDPSTGLASRAEFDGRLTAAVAERPAGAVLVVEIVNLAEVSAVLGQEFARELVAEAGRRLRRTLGSADVIAREGAGAFAVVSVEAVDEYAVEDVARRLRDATDTPTMLAGVQVAAHARIGAALWPEHGDGPDLVRRAEAALRDAHTRGVACAVYRPSQDALRRRRLAIGGELRDAVDRAEFICHYQPKIEILTGRLVGVEALVRWEHPRRGLLMPDAFIPVAEQGALMPGVTVHVLDAALAQCRRWSHEGHPLPVAANLSARQVSDPELPRMIGNMLAHHRVDPGLIELEVTETAVMADPETARRVLGELAALGVGLSIDDFGVGQTSLRYLSELPVGCLKIDRAFVSGITTRAADRQIVEAICGLAQVLDLVVVGEGVEDAETATVLAGLGCTYAQGYHYGRPVPASDLVMAVPIA